MKELLIKENLLNLNIINELDDLKLHNELFSELYNILYHILANELRNELYFKIKNNLTKSING